MDGESQEEREARIRALFRKLDTKKKGTLDLHALRIGLANMDHPLANAESLLQEVITTADINRDGKISFEEFRKFVHQTEKEVWELFKAIDHDDNGKLDKSEISTAFQRAGIKLDGARFDRFFNDVDSNQDGQIDFAEWRDFLIFLPSDAPNIKAVFSYYQSSVKVSAEGDVTLSDESLQGLGMGTLFQSLNVALFGAVTQLVRPSSSPPRDLESPTAVSSAVSGVTAPQLQASHDIFDTEEYEPSPEGNDPYLPVKPARRKEQTLADQADSEPAAIDFQIVQARRIKLIDFVPSAGYFVAGGLAGITSRTATAPLDRLKVYLIAQTGGASEAVQAAKSGAAVQATKASVSTLKQACLDLWAAGGIRSLFAGNGLNVVKVMPESAVKFGSYEAAKRAIASLEGHNDPSRISHPSQFTAGGVAGMISQAVVYPLDTLKFRMQCETVAGGDHGNRLIINTAKKMWARNGIASFYRGLPMGLVGMFPYAAIDLGTFEFLKRRLVARYRRLHPSSVKDEDALPGNFTLALMGGCSGAIGASAVYPLNLLRTRLQSQGTASHPRTYGGIMDVTRQTIKGEGFRGLFKGLTPNLLKVVPAVSITYVVYENCKTAMHLQ